MKKVILNVEGMMCSHCKAAVEEALKKVDGVSIATADIDAKQAEISCADEVDNSALVAAVESVGFDVVL